MGSAELGVFDARFIPSLWLPISAVAFALISLFPLVRRSLRRQPIAFSWVGVARAVGCFAGLWAGGLAGWLLAHGAQLYAVWFFGLLGFLLTIPWRVITKAWLWWGLFTLLSVFTLVPLLALCWLFIAFALSPPLPQGLAWSATGLLPVAILLLQVFAVWRLRRRRLSYHAPI